MAKIAIRGKKDDSQVVPPEERWVVVGDENSPRPHYLVYLLSPEGITKEEALSLASRLKNAIAVPYLSLEGSRYNPEKVQESGEEASQE